MSELQFQNSNMLKQLLSRGFHTHKSYTSYDCQALVLRGPSGLGCRSPVIYDQQSELNKHSCSLIGRLVLTAGEHVVTCCHALSHVDI